MGYIGRKQRRRGLLLHGVTALVISMVIALFWVGSVRLMKAFKEVDKRRAAIIEILQEHCDASCLTEGLEKGVVAKGDNGSLRYTSQKVVCFCYTGNEMKEITVVHPDLE